MRVLVVIGTFGVAVACASAGAFVCESDAECRDGSTLGVCQPGGYCSFPDGECTSGQRYGQHVAAGLEGQCVPTADASDGSAGDAGATSSASAGADDGIDGGPGDGSSGGDPATGTGPVAVDEGTGSSDGGVGESTTGPEELDPDLVLWLTFDDPRAPFADASMYARTVTCDPATSQCPTSVAGAMDPAALFDGINDLLEVAHDATLETDQGLTVAVRVRNDLVSDPLIHTVIARPYGVSAENAWEVFFRDENADGTNDVVFEIADPAGQVQTVATPAIAKGEWMHIVAVWTADSSALWFDGVLEASMPNTGMLLDDSPIVVGADYDDLAATNWFQGAIDDVRVYRRALTDAEIAALP